MKILVFPKDPNPYQDLLYSKMQLGPDSPKITYLNGPTKIQEVNLLLLPFLLIFYRLCGYTIFHIHWFYTFRIPIFDRRPSKVIMHFYTLMFMMFVKLLGYKIVWTVHEVITHTANNGKEVAMARSTVQYLSRIANAKIVHSSATLNEMIANKINVDHCFTIPHGPYDDVYPSSITPSAARKVLKIKNGEFVILFFGNIRKYKGLDALLDTFSHINSPNVRLIIAGKSRDELIAKKIHNLQKTQRIDFYDDYISVDNVAIYFKACDVVCLPFREITTSGSALLALTFAKPIIAPRMGALVDLPDDVGFLYDPLDKDALYLSLKRAISDNQLQQKSMAARLYIKQISWYKIAERTKEIYGIVTRA